jgi:hypothetical protein
VRLYRLCLIDPLNPNPEIRESSSSSSSCSSSIYWASAPMKEPIFLAIILFRLCDGENSPRKVAEAVTLATLIRYRSNERLVIT